MRIRPAAVALIGSLVAGLPAAGQAVRTGFLDRVVAMDGHDYPYQVYVPSAYEATESWPVILFLHGAGERGSDGLLQTAVGLAPAIRRDAARYPAIVVFPQSPRDSLWTGTPAQAAMAALERTMEEFSVDPDRVYLTGLSMGGHGTWYLAYRHPERFAAVVPICAWVRPRPDVPRASSVVPPEDGEPFEVLARRLRDVPIWIFHGEVDRVVPVEESREAAAALEAAGADVRYTELLGVDHDSWDAAYGSPELTTWLFAQRRGSRNPSGAWGWADADLRSLRSLRVRAQPSSLVVDDT
ncbi:MAG: alpha/beta hydrolase-fold protein, partial [Gemmatimonadota bacterium]